jgi:predicted alpha/beta-fold hydrolase
MLLLCFWIFIFLLLCFLYYCHKPKVGTTFAYRNTAFNQALRENILKEVGHYIPPWWYNMHLGSLVQFGKSPELVFCREVYKHEDGTSFAVDWYPITPKQAAQSNTEVLVTLYFPGLGLSSNANVAQNYAVTMAAAGIICGILVPRGHLATKSPMTSSKPWHAGCTEDAKHLLTHLVEITQLDDLRKRNFNYKVFLTGYSASSNIVLMTLSDLSAEYKSKTNSKDEIFIGETKSVQVIGGLGVCVNYDYVATRTLLEQTFLGNLYSRLLVLQFQHLLNANKHIHPDLPCDLLEKLTNARVLSEYDSAACSWYGFDSEESMYLRLSPKHPVECLNVPFVAIQPTDDPLYYCSHGKVEDGIAIKEYVKNPNVFFLKPSHGNHFGFYEGPLSQAFSNTTSYTYPPNVAMVVIQTIRLFKLTGSEKKCHVKESKQGPCGDISYQI